MVSQYLVDTDWIIDALHGQTAAVETLENLAPLGLAVSLISYGELYEGAYWAAANREAHLEGVHTFSPICSSSTDAWTQAGRQTVMAYLEPATAATRCPAYWDDAHQRRALAEPCCRASVSENAVQP